MNKEFIPYEQALELKQLGFQEECVGLYDVQKRLFNRGTYKFVEKETNVLAPLYQQAFRWFRKNNGLYSSILPKKSYPDNYVSGVEWYVTICGGDGVEIGPDGTYDYQEAEIVCLKKLIEIVGTIELSKQPTVISENGNELLFDKEGNLIKELPQQENLYTEEQVREIVSLIRTELAKNQYNHYSINYEEIIQSVKQPKK